VGGQSLTAITPDLKVVTVAWWTFSVQRHGGLSSRSRYPFANIRSWRRRSADWWQMPAPSWPRSRQAGERDHDTLDRWLLLMLSERRGVPDAGGAGLK
jgi:hypothetical protein